LAQKPALEKRRIGEEGAHVKKKRYLLPRGKEIRRAEMPEVEKKLPNEKGRNAKGRRCSYSMKRGPASFVEKKI